MHWFARTYLGIVQRKLLKKQLVALFFLLIFLIMLQHLLGINLNIDAADFHRTIQPYDIYPGRMSISSAVALMLFSAGLLINADSFELNVFTDVDKRKKIVQSLAVAVVILGCLGLFAHWLVASQVYSGVDSTRMSVPASICSLLLGYALYHLAIVANEAHYAKDTDPHVNVNKIYHTSTFVVTLLCVVAGIIGFSLLAQQSENLAADKLLQMTKDRIYMFNMAITARSERALVAAKDPHIGLLLSQSNQMPKHSASLKQLKVLASSFAENGFSAIVFERPNGEVVPGFGDLSSNDKSAINIGGKYKGELLWDGGYLLRSKTPLYAASGASAGYMVTEQALKSLDVLHEQAERIAISSDFLLCGKKAATLLCFPSHHDAAPYELPKFYQKQRVPMSVALDLNQTSIQTVLDQDGKRKLAAYGPIGDKAIGVAITINIADIYATFYQQLLKTIAFVISLTALGLWLIRQRMLPIVKQVDEDRAQAELARERFAAAANGGFDGFYIFETVRGARNEMIDFRCVFINKNWQRLYFKKTKRICRRAVV